MRGNDAYGSGIAIWAAATARAKSAASAAGGDPGALIRRFVFERFLARVFHDPDAPWVLKGGTAVLARVHEARATKDIDLLHQLGDLNAAVDALRTTASIELGDHFRFVVARVEHNLGGAGQPAVDGLRVVIDGYCGATRKATFGVDLVTGSLMTAPPELLTDPILDLRGIEAPTLRLYPVVDHIADKLCATQASYGTHGDRPSSRVRDLVDLVVFARSQDVDGSALITAVRGEWTHRGLPGAPEFSPPSGWEHLFPPLARKVPAVADVQSFVDAVALVKAFLDPVLSGRAAGQRWLAGDLSWVGAPS